MSDLYVYGEDFSIYLMGQARVLLANVALGTISVNDRLLIRINAEHPLQENLNNQNALATVTTVRSGDLSRFNEYVIFSAGNTVLQYATSVSGRPDILSVQIKHNSSSLVDAYFNVNPTGGDLYNVRFPVFIRNSDTGDVFMLQSTLKAGGLSGAVPQEADFIYGEIDIENTLSGVQVITQPLLDAAVYLGQGYSPIDTDPYAPEGPSATGGGGGTFDDTSDPNPIPSDPLISATDTGFMTVFATNLAGIQSLSASLWADIFPATLRGGALEETVQALKNIVGSPYDAILGCHIVPVSVPYGAAKNVKLYGVLPSNVSLNVAASQWVHKDCGTLTIPHFDGSYLDYAPYTKVTSMYLPFIGVVPIDIDIIMDTTIGVYYKIDIVSGQCIAYITKNGDVYFQYQGQCAVPLPVTSIDWSNTVNAGLGIIGSISSIVGSAVGGFGAGGAAGALAGGTKKFIGEAGSMAQNVMNSKPDIKSGSGIGGSAALMGCKNPYLIIERPRKSTPKIGDLSQNHWTGYPSNIAARLGDLSGYTEVSRVFVNRTTATAEEKQEIERLLTEGVYI